MKASRIELLKGHADRALNLRSGPIEDPFMEPYRILTEAGILLQKGRYREAVDGIRKADTLLKHSYTFRHPAGNNAASLYSKAIYRYSELCPDSSFIRSYMAGMVLEDLIRCADAAAFAEDSALALDLLRLAGVRGRNLRDEIPADRLKRFIIKQADIMTAQEITNSIMLSFRLGWEEIPQMLLSVMQRSYPESDRTVLIKAEFLRRNDDVAEAIRIVSDFHEGIPDGDLKAEYTLKLASLNYDAGRTTRSAEIYWRFAENNPELRYSLTIADRAARMYLSMGRWEKARRMWRFIRTTGSDHELVAESSVSEAVLDLWLGREGKARGILLDNLNKAPEGMTPAFFYWLHRACSSKEEKRKWAEKLIMEFPLSFYALALRDPAFELFLKSGSSMCGARFENHRGRAVQGNILREDSTGGFEIIRGHPAFNALSFYLELGDNSEASEILDLMLRDFEGDEDSLYLIATMLRDVKMKNLLLNVAVTPAAYRSNRFLQFRFPLYEPDRICKLAARHGISPELVMAVIREESRFDREAESRAGALGLMQITPPTGLWIAQMNGERIEAEQLLEPELNTRLGTWYIEYLLKRSGGSVVGAISAYNAGFGKLSGWRERFDPLRNPMIAAELIGIRETRRYLKRVLGSALMYRSIYTAEKD